MKQDVFGSIIYDGKMINVDQEEIENLRKISLEIREKNKSLEEKVEKIFKQ